MRIKHNKFRNTGVLFELLVRQIASDTLANTDSKAVKIVKKFFVINGANYTKCLYFMRIMRL